MSYANPKEFLDAATALPAAIEAVLPSGAPKISAKLLTFNTNLANAPKFPFALPNLPPVPTLPTMPGAPSLGRRVTGVTVIPIPTPTAVPPRPAEAAGPSGSTFTFK